MTTADATFSTLSSTESFVRRVPKEMDPARTTLVEQLPS
jgi:hypothetical protein